jgi:hypothetical protein
MMHYVSSISWRNLPDSGTVLFSRIEEGRRRFHPEHTVDNFLSLPGLDDQLFPVVVCASSLASIFLLNRIDKSELLDDMPPTTTCYRSALSGSASLVFIFVTALNISSFSPSFKLTIDFVAESKSVDKFTVSVIGD